MSKEISHTGKVISVGPQVTTVEIVSKSACASCHAASLCTAFESVRKEVEVPTDPSAGFAVGDEVEVQLRGSLGPKAAVLAYVIPLFILLILVVSLSFTGMHELPSGWAAWPFGMGSCGCAAGPWSVNTGFMRGDYNNKT